MLQAITDPIFIQKLDEIAHEALEGHFHFNLNWIQKHSWKVMPSEKDVTLEKMR